MILGILTAIAVLNTLLTFLALAAAGRLVVDQRDKFDAFLGYAELGIRNYAELDEKVQNALDCLVTTDAKLDAVNPEETRTHAA
jgi:hypothetical protein